MISDCGSKNPDEVPAAAEETVKHERTSEATPDKITQSKRNTTDDTDTAIEQTPAKKAKGLPKESMDPRPSELSLYMENAQADSDKKKSDLEKTLAEQKKEYDDNEKKAVKLCKTCKEWKIWAEILEKLARIEKKLEEFFKQEKNFEHEKNVAEKEAAESKKELSELKKKLAEQKKENEELKKKCAEKDRWIAEMGMRTSELKSYLSESEGFDE